MYSKEKNAKNNFLISFRCLHPTGVVLPFATQKCMKTVVACFKLHNKCIKNRLLMPDRGGLWYPAPGWEGNQKSPSKQCRCSSTDPKEAGSMFLP